MKVSNRKEKRHGDFCFPVPQRIIMPYKIFIDQGHNPVNPNAGAEGNGFREQDLVYKIGVLTAEYISSDPEFVTRLSRKSPTENLGNSNATSLKARVDDANSWGADFYISLHANASSIASASGSEGFAYSTSSAGYPMGTDILEEISRTTGLQNRGMSLRPSLYVLRKTRMPAVLIELGFITNIGDALLMNDSPQLFARGVAAGVFRYYGRE